MAQRRGVNRRHEFLTDSVHLFVLSAFAIAQPLFDLLSRNAAFFVARYSQPVDIIILVLIVCYGAPLLLILIEGLASVLGRPARKSLHGLLVATLAASVILPALRPIGVPGPVLIAGAAVFGVLIALTISRFDPLRLFLTVLAPAAVIFPGIFLFYSPVSKVIFVQPSPDAVDITIETPPPVVMVVFDEFRVRALMDEHRQIDASRYPNFAALARDATWFRNATTVSDYTIAAVPALLTGNYPDRFRLPTAVNYPHNLFTLLGKTYTVRGFESQTQLCPDRLCGDRTAHESIASRMGSLLSDLSVVYLHILLPADMGAGLPPITQGWMHFTANAADTTAEQKDRNLQGEWQQAFLRHPAHDRHQHFQQFRETISPAQEPRLYFLHSLLPHVPYIYLPSGRISRTNTHLDALLLKREHLEDNETAVTQAYQRYLLQVGFVDTLVGTLVARLKTVGLYDRSLLVITADHGVSFRRGDAHRTISESNYCDIMPVPLFIKAPYQREGLVSDRNVETIDILPTIADLLGIRLPWAIDGRSAFGTALPERIEKVMFSAGPRVVSHERRLVFRPTLETVCNALEPALVDKRPDEVGVTGGREIFVELDHPNIYERVDLKSGGVPRYVTGRIVRNDERTSPLDLAVTVNGKIQAVTQAVQRRGRELRFSAAVPKAAFRAGRNAVEVFGVSLEGKSPRLHYTQSAGVSYTLMSASAEREEVIVAADGASIQLIPHAVHGYVDTVLVAGDLINFVGWAADVKNYELPAAILILADGELRCAGRPNGARPDVARVFGNAALQEAGFSYTLPLQLFEQSDNLEVRVFAVLEKGVGSELIYLPGYRWRKK